MRVRYARKRCVPPMMKYFMSVNSTCNPPHYAIGIEPYPHAQPAREHAAARKAWREEHPEADTAETGMLLEEAEP